MPSYVIRSAEGQPHLLTSQEPIPSSRWPVYGITCLLDMGDPEIESLCKLAENTNDKSVRATLIKAAERLSDLAAPVAGPLRSWEISCIGAGFEHLSAEAVEGLTTILERFDSIQSLTVDTDTGSLHATRARPEGYTQDVDDALISVFSSSPGVRAVAFNGSGGASGRVATPQDPFWSPRGKDANTAAHQSELGSTTSDSP
jgi:hypothetical protein